MSLVKRIVLAGVGSVALVAGYAAVSALSNVFYKKGYTAQEIARLIVVAHRGGAALGPENTLLAIERGIASGADMVEIDIHQTSDGKVVVCHDESIDRTTNGRGLIRDLTFEEIRGFNIVDKDGNVTDQKIPTLDEVLDLIDGKVKLLVEIKRTADIYQGIEQQLVDAIAAHKASSWVVAQSFNDSVLEKLHAISPDLRLEKLWVFKLRGVDDAVDGWVNDYSYEKYNYVSSFNFYYRSVTDSLIDEIHRHGKEVKIWTVGSPADTPHLPVDGIITDHPDLWRTK